MFWSIKIFYKNKTAILACSRDQKYKLFCDDIMVWWCVILDTWRINEFTYLNHRYNFVPICNCAHSSSASNHNSGVFYGAKSHSQTNFIGSITYLRTDCFKQPVFSEWYAWLTLLPYAYSVNVSKVVALAFVTTQTRVI